MVAHPSFLTNMFSILPSLLLPFLDLYTHQANCLKNAVGLRTIRMRGVNFDSNRRCLALFHKPNNNQHVALLGKSLTHSLYIFAWRIECFINLPNDESPHLNKKPHKFCKAASSAQPRYTNRPGEHYLGVASQEVLFDGEVTACSYSLSVAIASVFAARVCHFFVLPWHVTPFKCR